MSAVQTLGSTLLSAGTPASATPAPAEANTALTQQDFLSLLTTQMQYQDPENPVSDTDFASQLAQFTSLQGIQQLNTSFTQMLTQQQVSQSANLIGTQVTFNGSATGSPSSGVVNSVQINNGAVQLMVGNQTVPLSQVTSIAAGGSII